MTESAQSTSSPEAEAEGGYAAEGLQAPAESHPTRKQLKEFMQLLLREFLLGAPNPKQWVPLEVLLEVGWHAHMPLELLVSPPCPKQGQVQDG